MRRSIVISAIVILVIILALIFAYHQMTKNIARSTWRPPASVHDRVDRVVQQWADLKNPPSNSDQLSVLWAPQPTPFNPDGAQRLVKDIRAEFSGPPVVCNCITTNDVINNIKTVGDLAAAVPGCP